MIWLAATAAAFQVVEAPVEAPHDAVAPRVPLIVRFEGGPARIEARAPGHRWRPLSQAAPAPFRTRPLPRGTELRAIRDGEVVGTGRAPGVWTPSDVAAWSGTGLPGVVNALASDEAALWAATAGGVAVWDGARWSVLGPRDGLPGVDVSDLALTHDGAWVATDGGLARIVDGRVAHRITREHGLPDAATTALALQDDTVWAATPRGAVHIRGEAVTPVRGAPCPWLHADLDRVWAGCDGLVRLPDGVRVAGVPRDVSVTALLPAPGGRFVATRERGVLHLRDGVATPLGGPDTVHDLAAGPDGLWLAAGDDGLWRADRGAPEPVPGYLGVPAPVNAVAPGPAGKVWAGTDRGVVLYDPSGLATALPLAPLPAGVPARAVAPHGRGVAVAGDAGLVWVGVDEPRGFGSLSAAVGPGATSVVRVGQGWWATGPGGAYHLDPEGTVRRWDAHAPPLGVVGMGDAVAVAVAEGTRLWVPGATQLSPLRPDAVLRAVDHCGDGALWTAHDRGVTRRFGPLSQDWAVPSVRDVAADPAGAWVATDEGLLRVHPSVDAPRVVDGPWSMLTAVASEGPRVWVADADGRIWGPDLSAPAPVALGDVRVRDLAVDAHGVWAATDAGVFRITAP